MLRFAQALLPFEDFAPEVFSWGLSSVALHTPSLLCFTVWVFCYCVVIVEDHSAITSGCEANSAMFAEGEVCEASSE